VSSDTEDSVDERSEEEEERFADLSDDSDDLRQAMNSSDEDREVLRELARLEEAEGDVEDVDDASNKLGDSDSKTGTNKGSSKLGDSHFLTKKQKSERRKLLVRKQQRRMLHKQRILLQAQSAFATEQGGSSVMAGGSSAVNGVELNEDGTAAGLAEMADKEGFFGTNKDNEYEKGSSSINDPDNEYEKGTVEKELNYTACESYLRLKVLCFCLQTLEDMEGGYPCHYNSSIFELVFGCIKKCQRWDVSHPVKRKLTLFMLLRRGVLSAAHAAGRGVI
jgi:hypothetical protein